MRSKETIQQELTETRTRLSAYLAREADMLSKDGVQLYTLADRLALLRRRLRDIFAPLDTAAAAVFNYLQGGEKNEVRPNEGAISPG